MRLSHPRLDVSNRALLGLLAVCLLLVTIVGWVVADSRRVAWHHAAETSTNLVTALAHDIERTIESYDLSLLAAGRGLTAPAFGTLDPVTRQLLLFDGSVEARNMGSVFVMNPLGEIVYESGRLVPRQQDNAARDYFKVHRDRPDVGLYVSRPYRSTSTGEWSLAFSRRIDAADGSFAGVVAGSIRYSYFKALFGTLDLGADSTIGLLTTDGVLLYRSGGADSDIGRDFPNALQLQHLRSGQTAPFEAVSNLDGQRRLFAFTQVGALPLVLSVNTASATIFADWNRKALVTACLSLALVLVGALLVRMVFDQQRRRERAEQAVLRSTGMFRAYFENAADALFLIDIGANDTFRVGAINPACVRLTGISNEAAQGKTLAELFEPEVANGAEARYRACLAHTRLAHDGIYAYLDTRRLRGGPHDLHTVLSVIRDADGTPVTILGSSRDMTEQNRRQAELHEASKMKAIGGLTAGLAHDFNNHLQTIVGALDILAAEALGGPEAAEIGQVAHQAATKAGRLVHHLLAFSGQQVLRPRRMPVPTLFAETCKLVGPDVLGPGIHLAITVEPFTHDIHVDLSQAQSCLLGLLLNARDAMPNGGALVLHARNAGADDARFGALEAGAHVILAVQDTGHGMDEATIARAFEPFFTTKTFGQGAGLGLSMVQGFCRQSGGDIRIVSGSGRGTRMELWLPAAPGGAPAEQERAMNLATIGHDTGRIMLAQSGPDTLATMGSALVGSGFGVVAVGSALDGLARLRERHRYDALLVDETLAGMSCTDFLDRARVLAPGLPVLQLGIWAAGGGASRHTAVVDALREAVGAKAAAPAL